MDLTLEETLDIPFHSFPDRKKLEAARELKNGENSDWVTKQLKKALDPKDRDTVEV